jgi:hypothetical protein
MKSITFTVCSFYLQLVCLIDKTIWNLEFGYRLHRASCVSIVMTVANSLRVVMLSISTWKAKATTSCTMVMIEQLKRRLQNFMTLAAGMTALIVVLPLIVVVEISLQLHQGFF